MDNEITTNPLIEESWKDALGEEFNAPYFKEIERKLIDEKRAGGVLYPQANEIFNAFNWMPCALLNLVIIVPVH